MVIDPGHGGENLGGHTDEFIEKELTIKVAKYMKERLEQYDGVEVYMTRESDIETDLNREERADIAKAHNADFMFSIHFNMSADHELYGAEVWTSAFGDYYKKGQEFGKIEVEALNELGFYNRGVKTRLGNDGDDYYGAILHPKNAGIPAVIIEHCHMDEDRDADYLRQNGEEAYKTFGYLDADCVAKYFHLSSPALGVDYSGYKYEEVQSPAQPIGSDMTPADVCNIELMDADTEAGTATVRVTAKDNESNMLYYRCSYDGGVTFDKVYPWSNDKSALKAEATDSVDIKVDLKPGADTELVVKTYNAFDRKADSNVLTLPAMAVKEEEGSGEEAGTEDEYGYFALEDENYGEASESHTKSAGLLQDTYTELNVDTLREKDNKSGTGVVVLAILVLIAAIATFGYIMYVMERRKRRREAMRRRKRRSVHSGGMNDIG